MRVSQTFGALAEPYDRLHDTFAGGIATGAVTPHTETERLNITVPTGYKVWLTSIFLKIRRISIPTTPGLCYVRLMYTMGGGSPIDLAYISYGGTSLLDEQYLNLTNIGFFDGGDHLIIYTSDNSTGGTVDYSAFIRGIRFR